MLDVDDIFGIVCSRVDDICTSRHLHVCCVFVHILWFMNGIQCLIGKYRYCLCQYIHHQKARHPTPFCNLSISSQQIVFCLLTLKTIQQRIQDFSLWWTVVIADKIRKFFCTYAKHRYFLKYTISNVSIVYTQDVPIYLNSTERSPQPPLSSAAMQLQAEAKFNS